MTKAKGDGGKWLYVRRRSAQRDMEQGTYSAWSKSQERSNRLKYYICQSEEHLNKDCPREKTLRFGSCVLVPAFCLLRFGYDWIIDSGGSYHITYMRDYLVDFEEYDGGNILFGNGRECCVRGTGKVQVQMRDGSSFVLDSVMYILELRRNLISLGTLEKEGFTVKMQSAKIKFIKGSLVVLSGTRRANCIYTLDGQAMTRKTLKGRKQLGQYQTGWKIKTGNVLDSCNQRSTQQCTKSGVAKHLGVAGLQQQNRLVKKTNVTLLAKVEIWATNGLLDKAKGNVLGMEIVRDQSGNTLRVSHSRFYNRKLVQNLLERHFVLSLEGSLLGDCDVEKNGKWSCIYVVGIQEYQVVCTRPDTAPADVDMLDGGVHDTYGGCKGGYLAKGTRNKVRIRAKYSSGYCYACLVKGGPRIEVTARVEAAVYRRFLI
nr:zinc finger, CCHC-type [Tanacetum cinerariifolium]